MQLDEVPKPVYDDIPQLMGTLGSSRDVSPMPLGCVEVDPYAVPSWNQSLMASFADYLDAADDGNGDFGHVEVQGPGGCPSP